MLRGCNRGLSARKAAENWAIRRNRKTARTAQFIAKIFNQRSEYWWCGCKIANSAVIFNTCSFFWFLKSAKTEAIVATVVFTVAAYCAGYEMLYFALVELCLRPRIATSTQFLSITTYINRNHFGLRMCAEHVSFSTNASAVDEWYKSGLKFKCTECGDCCSGASGSVRFNDDEGKAIANRLNVSFDKFLENYSRLNHFNQREFKEVQVGHCKLQAVDG